MIFLLLINIGFGGSIVAMIRFSKYCRLLNRRWTLSEEEEERYQAKARHWLAATGGLIAVAGVSMVLGIFFS